MTVIASGSVTGLLYVVIVVVVVVAAAAAAGSILLITSKPSPWIRFFNSIMPFLMVLSFRTPLILKKAIFRT